MSDGSVVIDTKLNNKGVEDGLNKISEVAKSALKKLAVAVSIGQITKSFTDLVKASVNARGEMEQQIGGVETLFKDSAKEVIENANKAYKTAGMSAVEYMNTATSFSASLIKGLGGDTKKAAEYANMAIVDMSDNANKMGTSIESIQNAYQGLAKGNATMLDNLKIGYGRNTNRNVKTCKRYGCNR